MGCEREFRGVVEEWFWKNYAHKSPDRASFNRLTAQIKKNTQERMRAYLNLKILDILRIRGQGHLGKTERNKLYRTLMEVVGGRADGIARSTVHRVRVAFDDLFEAEKLTTVDAAEDFIDDAIDKVSREILDRVDREVEASVERIVAP